MIIDSHITIGEIALTISTLLLVWATIHLWASRDRALLAAKLKPWKRTHTLDVSDGQYHETDMTEVGELKENDPEEVSNVVNWQGLA